MGSENNVLNTVREGVGGRSVVSLASETARLAQTIASDGERLVEGEKCNHVPSACTKTQAPDCSGALTNLVPVIGVATTNARTDVHRVRTPLGVFEKVAKLLLRVFPR